MSFDLGSFFGGIIGSIGAFLAAVFTIRKQMHFEKPKRNRLKYSTIIEIEYGLSKLSWDLVYGLDRDYKQLMLEVIKFMDRLNQLIPNAIEADDEIILLIKEINNKLHHFNTEVWTKETEKTPHNYTYFVNKILHEYIEKCLSMREKIMKIKAS